MSSFMSVSGEDLTGRVTNVVDAWMIVLSGTEPGEKKFHVFTLSCVRKLLL